MSELIRSNETSSPVYCGVGVGVVVGTTGAVGGTTVIWVFGICWGCAASGCAGWGCAGCGCVGVAAAGAPGAVSAGSAGSNAASSAAGELERETEYAFGSGIIAGP